MSLSDDVGFANEIGTNYAFRSGALEQSLDSALEGLRIARGLIKPKNYSTQRAIEEIDRRIASAEQMLHLVRRPRKQRVEAAP
jgi:hypothetical protein